MSIYCWNDLLYRKIVAGEKEMLALIILKKACIISIHRHNEQFSYILKGALKFYTMPNKSTIVKEGVFHILSNLKHGSEALEDR